MIGWLFRLKMFLFFRISYNFCLIFGKNVFFCNFSPPNSKKKLYNRPLFLYIPLHRYAFHVKVWKELIEKRENTPTGTTEL